MKINGDVVTEGLAPPPKTILSPTRWFDICVACIIFYAKYLHKYFLALIAQYWCLSQLYIPIATLTVSAREMSQKDLQVF